MTQVLRDDWGWMFSILDREITGAGGGGITRDECMKKVEEHILNSIQEIQAVSGYYERKIFDSLVQVDKTTKEWYQERLE